MEEFDLDTLIRDAFRISDIGLLRNAINRGANVNYIRYDADGTTPLMAASFCGDSALVDILLNRSVNPTVSNDAGYTAGNIAEIVGYGDIARQLYVAENEWNNRALLVDDDGLLTVNRRFSEMLECAIEDITLADTDEMNVDIRDWDEFEYPDAMGVGSYEEICGSYSGDLTVPY